MKKLVISLAFLSALALSCDTKHVEDQRQTIDSPIITNDISNQKVTSFAEDAQGHIWIGTFRGLNRFNVHEYQQHFCTGD